MVSVLVALGLLTAMGAVGAATLRRARLGLDPLEQVAYGVPLGAVAGSLALLVLAIPFGLTDGVVIAVGAVCAFAAGYLWTDAPSRSVGIAPSWVRNRPWVRVGLSVGARAGLHRISLLPTLVIGAFVVRWALLWADGLTYDDGALWAGQINIWGDWPQHLGDVASFAHGDNVPPEHPRYAGTPYGYHFLASLTAAAMVKAGMDPASALTLHSFAFSVPIILGVYAYGRRLTRDRGAATLAVVLFFLGGGLGWLLTAGEMDGPRGVWGTLIDQPWDVGRQRSANFRWENVYIDNIEPQRAQLYGLPISLLTLTLLHAGLRSGRRRVFVAAGVVAGLLPFAHLGPLPTLALVAGGLVLLSPLRHWRNWIVFFGTWAVVSAPQLYLQQGGERGTTSGLRWHWGWVARPDDSLVWFWVKNLGWFLPLLALALATRGLVPPAGRRMLWAFMPIFVAANLIAFQPDPFDNVKMLVYWFLAVSVLVAALLVRTWRAHRALAVRGLLVGTVATMLLSGLLVNLHQLLGLDRYQLATAEEVDLARRVRATTPPDAVFLVGLRHSQPVAMLSGRSVLMTFPGWLWVRGIDYAERERDLRAIYALVPTAEDLLTKYDIDYIVIGPAEQDDLGADPAAFRSRFPTLLRTPHYDVFAVDPP